MKETHLLKIIKAFEPFATALAATDRDTLGRLSNGDKVLFTSQGSWTNPVQVTLGDLRRLSEAIYSTTDHTAIPSHDQSPSLTFRPESLGDR